MKGLPFLHRLRFALAGLAAALHQEASFRLELIAAVAALVVTTWLQPPLVWFALVVAMIAAVLAAELLNTALERALDALHPQPAPLVRIAKDCGGAAVLVLSAAAAAVFLLMLFSTR